MDNKPKPKGRVKQPSKGALCMVYWDDAGDHLEPGWQESKDVVPVDLHMVSIGIFLGAKKGNVMLAGSKCLSDENVNTISQVPVGCVKRIVELVEKPDGVA